LVIISSISRDWAGYIDGSFDGVKKYDFLENNFWQCFVYSPE
jgi:hypothetical protein